MKKKEVARVNFHEIQGFGEKSDQIPIYGRFELHGHFPLFFSIFEMFFWEQYSNQGKFRTIREGM